MGWIHGGGGATQGPGTPKHLAHCLPGFSSCPQVAPPTPPPLGHSGGGGGFQRSSRVKCPKFSRCPNLVCGVRWGDGRQQEAAELRPQAAKSAGMALNTVPRKVGVLGYGRLGESLTVWGFLPRPLSRAPEAPVLHKHTFLLCLYLWLGCLWLTKCLPLLTAGLQPPQDLRPPLSESLPPT